MAESNKQNRILKYDLLRMIAAFSVVVLHASAQFWYTLDIRSTEWVIANTYDSIFRFGVPVFVMISGAVFLDESYKLGIKRLYTHNILRLLVLYIIWQVLYGILDYSKYDPELVGRKELLTEVIYGRYHLWFLPMIIGIYMLLPLLKEWLAHARRRTVEYFLLLFLVFQIGSETLRAFTVTDELHLILDRAKPYMVCGYLGYFIWGYYLKKYGLGPKLRKLVYILVLPSLAVAVLGTRAMSLKLGVPTLTGADSFAFPTFLIATALFIWEPWGCAGEKTEIHADNENCGNSGENEVYVLSADRENPEIGKNNDTPGVKLIKELSRDTLGVYILHIGFIEIMEGYGLHSMTVPIGIGIPLLSIVCFVSCSILAAILRRIPFIGKYIA